MSEFVFTSVIYRDPREEPVYRRQWFNAAEAWQDLAQQRAADAGDLDYTVGRLSELAIEAREYPHQSCGVIYGPTSPDGTATVYAVQADERDVYVCRELGCQEPRWVGKNTQFCKTHAREWSDASFTDLEKRSM